jgi:16S rRNA (adenine1518-N6/adenine1519-N6)-dimethyltransferase
MAEGNECVLFPNMIYLSHMVRPKKFLGQHFLKDQNIAARIVDALDLPDGTARVIEIGPGTGVLTQLLVKRKDIDLWLIELDHESVVYLKENMPLLRMKIIEGDFLRLNLDDLFTSNVSIIGNFPYNISSQIFFRVLEYRSQVTQVVCMLQKEVAERIASPHGSKVYGILSVLLQAYYDIELLFKVPPGVFFPPPKVMSAVIRLKRNKREHLSCNESLFVKVVKQGFQNRRKTLRNALKPLNLPVAVSALPIFEKRAEQLSVEEFISLTSLIEQSGEKAGNRI